MLYRQQDSTESIYLSPPLLLSNCALHFWFRSLLSNGRRDMRGQSINKVQPFTRATTSDGARQAVGERSVAGDLKANIELDCASTCSDGEVGGMILRLHRQK